MLEAEGLALGVVTAIAGQSRFNLVFEGHAGHAGTTPMDLRRDAATAAAEFVLAAERIARDEPGLVATVGELNVPRGAVNVIPGRAEPRSTSATRTTPCARARSPACGPRPRRSRAPRRRGHVVDDLRAARHPLHARAGAQGRRGRRVDRRQRARAAQRRRARRGDDGPRDRHRDAVRPLRGRHQPPSRRVRDLEDVAWPSRPPQFVEGARLHVRS